MHNCIVGLETFGLDAAHDPVGGRAKEARLVGEKLEGRVTADKRDKSRRGGIGKRDD